MLAVGTSCGKLHLVDTTTGVEHLNISTHQDARVLGVSVAPDGSMIATAGSDGTWKVWDLLGERLLCSRGHGTGASVTSIAFSPCGNLLATTGHKDGVPKLWDVRSGLEKRVLEGVKRGDIHDAGPAWTVSFSADGRRLASGGSLVQVWDLGKNLSPLRTTIAPRMPPVPTTALEMRTAVLFPDGRRLASGGWGLPPGVRVWDVASRATLAYTLADLDGCDPALPHSDWPAVLKITCWGCGTNANFGAEKSVGSPNW
ncbi:WD40-repeat-containing domain protein [Baffinella frigidus]|nr:WD40-repeat-containing domain protein [Cryptophyta sp. CCMP2293]